MSIVERSQHALALNRTNGLKVAVLFATFGIGCFVLEATGVSDLASPWLAAAILPNALIYIAVRGGKLPWFRGMALPCLLVLVASVALVWALHADILVPTVLSGGVLACWIAASGFLIWRMWTFEPEPPGKRALPSTSPRA
ncbi:hypothetical protein [Citromicrobium sp. JLT1363]|uniref:hypothetical protein n=1 Tax=Citromicrobium sp. JLT1363 TaxID=517722 RepID=UPI000225E42D|nr:hypothetical protein [Citromicrobium sp. JLT1363]